MRIRQPKSQYFLRGEFQFKFKIVNQVNTKYIIMYKNKKRNETKRNENESF